MGITNVAEQLNINKPVGELLAAVGEFVFYTADISLLGSIIQQFVGLYAEQLGCKVTPGEINTFPDMYVDGKPVEIKTHLSHRTAAFDLGNFYAMQDLAVTNSSHFDTDTMIVTYSSNKRLFQIEKAIVLPLWAVIGKSKDNNIKTQRKRGRHYAVRPCSTLDKPVWSSKDEVINAFATMV